MRLPAEEAHFRARMNPQSPEERKIVSLLNALTFSIDEHLKSEYGSFPDANTSEAYGQMLEGVQMLLNESRGRLDGGRLWEEVNDLAVRVCWDLNDSKIAWEGVEGMNEPPGQ